MSTLFSRRLSPIQAEQRGRGGLRKPFPWGKWMPRLDNFSSCFPCLSFVPPIHRRDSSKTEGFVFLPDCLNEGGVSGLAVGSVCSHTVETRCAASGPSYLAGWGQLGNWGQKQKGNFVANLHPLKWDFLKDDLGKYFQLVKVLKLWASTKGSWIPLSSEVLCGISQGCSRHICASQGVSLFNPTCLWPVCP